MAQIYRCHRSGELGDPEGRIFARQVAGAANVGTSALEVHTAGVLTVILIIAHIGPRNNLDGDWRAYLLGELENFFFVFIMIGLLITKRAWYHYAVIAIIMILVGGDYLVQTINS